MSKGLNIKQLKFIDNLFVGMSGKKAYIEAGYETDGHSAESCAYKLLRKAEIMEEIARRQEDIDKRNRIRLKRMSETALAQELSLISGNEIENIVKLNAIKDILDRAGLKPVEKHEFIGEVGYKLLDVDISKYPKAKNAVSVPAKNKRPKKGD